MLYAARFPSVSIRTTDGFFQETMATGASDMDPREFEKKTQDELDDILNR